MLRKISLGRRLAWVLCAITAASIPVQGRPAVAATVDSQIPIACPSEYAANGGPLLNMVYVSQVGFTGAAEIPFVLSYYSYKRGNASSGLAWYWPSPTTSVYAGSYFEWISGPGVLVRCARWTILYVGVLDIYTNIGHEGVAVLSDPGGGGSGGGSGGDGDGDGGGGGDGDYTDEPVCMDVYINGEWDHMVCS